MPWQNTMLGLVPFISLSFLYGCGEVNSFIGLPLISEGLYAAITPAATVLLVVKRNWRRFGCSSFDEGLSFSIVDDLGRELRRVSLEARERFSLEYYTLVWNPPNPSRLT